MEETVPRTQVSYITVFVKCLEYHEREPKTFYLSEFSQQALHIPGPL